MHTRDFLEEGAANGLRVNITHIRSLAAYACVLSISSCSCKNVYSRRTYRLDWFRRVIVHALEV